MPPDPPPRSSLGWRGIAPGWLAAALALVVFAPSLGHGFAYDDAFILRSPLLADPWNLRAVFTGAFYGPDDLQLGLYRPLGQWSLVLNAILARALLGSFEHPALFHAVNLVLHAAASYLVFAWLARLPIPRFVAGAAAVLWAVHPVHAEVAANVTARYESLAAVFGLLFLIAFRSGRGFAAALLLLAALFAKESALVFLPLALATDAIFPGEGRRARVLAPACAVIGIWFALRAIALHGSSAPVPFVENPIASGTFPERLPTAAWVQLLYLRDQLLPLWLSTDHSYAEIDLVRSLLDPRPLAFFAVVLVVAVASWALRRSRREVAFAVVGYAIAFSIASQFLVPIGTVMADRLAYLPSIFTCLLAATAIAAVGSPRARMATVVLAAGALAWASLGETPQWKSDLALFRRQVITSPRSAKSHGNLGNALRESGLLEEAAVEYRESIRIYPYRPEPHLGLAQTYEFQGADPELRIRTWADAIRYGTTGEEPLLQEALTWVDLGRWPEFAETRAKLAERDPGSTFLVHMARILRAAEQLAAEPVAPDELTELARGRDALRRGDFAKAESLLQGALHRGSVPPGEVAAVLADLSRSHAGLGHPRRAEHFARLAASARASPGAASVPR